MNAILDKDRMSTQVIIWECVVAATGSGVGYCEYTHECSQLLFYFGLAR